MDQTAMSNIVKVPGEAAFNDLLERITQAGVEMDPESKLTALAKAEGDPLLARAKVSVVAITEASGRRRGAPLPPKDH